MGKKNKRKRETTSDTTTTSNKRKSTPPDDGERIYSCSHCQPKFQTSDPIKFSNHVRHCKQKLSSANAITNKDTGKPIFDGVVCSISVWRGENDSTASSSSSSSNISTTNPWDESRVRSLLQQLGATHSRQIHKRVKYLIVSTSAITRQTQNVRKAAKKKIKMVCPEFLEACIATRRIVNAQDYVVENVVLPANSNQPKEKEEKEEKEEKDLSQKWDDAVVTDLGCCCACHDEDCWTDNKKPDDCEWCHDVCYS